MHRTRLRVRARASGRFVWPASALEIEAPDGSVSALARRGASRRGGLDPPRLSGSLHAVRGAPASAASAAQRQRLGPGRGRRAGCAGRRGPAWRWRAGAEAAPSDAPAEPGSAPAEPPWDRAREDLAEARERAAGDPFAGAHATARALRRYLARRFGADAIGRTSEELAAATPPFGARSRWPAFVAILRGLDEFRFLPESDRSVREALATRVGRAARRGRGLRRGLDAARGTAMSDALGEILRAAGIDGLARPGWLVAALLAALLAVLLAWRARPPAVGWPGEPEARAARARRGDPLRGLALVLRGAALAALAAVLAGPVGVHRAPPEPGFGLDLVLVVDASGSMRALDAELGGEWHTRLDLARQVVARFARQRAAEGDRVALVVLGETAFTQCPLTSDGGLLAAALERVEAGMAGEATALGDALALAVKRARGAATSGDLTLGRVAVLLSDGRHNAGTLSVEAATALAAAEGLRVHTVAIGSAGEEVPMASAARRRARPALRAPRRRRRHARADRRRHRRPLLPGAQTRATSTRSTPRSTRSSASIGRGQRACVGRIARSRCSPWPGASCSARSPWRASSAGACRDDRAPRAPRVVDTRAAAPARGRGRPRRGAPAGTKPPAQAGPTGSRRPPVCRSQATSRCSWRSPAW